MESNDSSENERDEEQMSQHTSSNSNSASVTVTGPIGVTGPRVIKFEYKDLTCVLSWQLVLSILKTCRIQFSLLARNISLNFCHLLCLLAAQVSSFNQVCVCLY